MGTTPTIETMRWAATSWSEDSARPIWLGRRDQPVFGWWHGPADGRARAGVLICPPLGFEYLQSHRALQVLATELSSEGFCVVRFDYDGTGDSSGGAADARLAAWTATARSALGLLRQHGLAELCVVGMRLGATFAAMLAGLDGEVDQLVLWDPCSRGRSFLTEQRALQRLAVGGGAVSREGALETPGMVYEAATVEDIDRMRVPRSSPLGRRVLVLTRDDRPTDGLLQEPTLATEELTHGVAAGQRELLDLVPPEQELPLPTIRRVVTWLSQGSRGTARAVSTPRPAGPAIVAHDTHGRPIVETPVAVPPAGLFGLLTEPAGGSLSRDLPTILMMNAGNQHHVGPARIWVDWSRAWATLGIRSLRFDFSGLGDSPFRNQVGGRWTCHKPAAFDDALDAARWACPDDPSNVVLMGLCSSGYQALESGLALQSRGVIAINPVTSFEPSEQREGAPLDPRRRIVLPKGDIAATFREGGRLGWLRDRFPDLAWRARGLLAPSRRSGPWLAQLVRNGTSTLLICGDSELRPIRQGITSLGLRRLQRGGLLRLEHLPGLGHVLHTRAERGLVLTMITDHLRSNIAPEAQCSSSAPGSIFSNELPSSVEQGQLQAQAGGRRA